jgi:hypothetical protein
MTGTWLLSYEWRPSDAPVPPTRTPPSSKPQYVLAEQWLAAARWEPKDIRWLLADVSQRRVSALRDELPGEARAMFDSLRSPFGPHRAPHRWRLAWRWFWATTLDGTGGLHAAAPAKLKAMPFAPPAGQFGWRMRVPYPVSARDQDRRVTGRDAGDAAAGRKEEIATERVLDPDPLSGQLTVLSRLNALHGITARGMWWWEEWKREEWPTRVDFDFLPASKRRVLLFVLCNKGISIWRYDLTARKNKAGESYLSGEWQRQGTFAAPFIEPFHVAAAQDAYFFVTDESGAVYAAEQRDGQWKTHTIWQDSSRPVVAMLVEADGATAFVFGKDFYLKLGRDTQPKACRDVTQGRKDLGEPMRTVFECARVLFEKGELGKDGLSR